MTLKNESIFTLRFGVVCSWNNKKKIPCVLCNRAFMFQMCFIDNNKWLFLFRNLGRDSLVSELRESSLELLDFEMAQSFE